MNRIKKLIAALLNFTVLLVLLLGSCTGPMLLYAESPRWLLKQADPDDMKTFFVAFRAKAADGATQLRVERHDFQPERNGLANVQYQLPEGRHNHQSKPGESSARIEVTREASGSQLVRVFMHGDTPWTSLSEYRVVDNKVQPLRHARSAAWLLLTVIACLVLTVVLMKRIRPRIRRWLGLDQTE